MGRTLAFLISFVSLIIGATSELQGAETVWSGLVIAENVAQPQTIAPELTRLEGLLKKFFGYNQFQVIGKSQKTLKTGQEDWLATSKVTIYVVATDSAVRIITAIDKLTCAEMQTV